MQLPGLTGQTPNAATAMSYTDGLEAELTPKAAKAFETIAQSLIDKIRREGTIPKTYRFWLTTSEPKLNRELMKKGVIRYAFTDAQGVEVYEHEVDAELIRKALALDKH